MQGEIVWAVLGGLVLAAACGGDVFSPSTDAADGGEAGAGGTEDVAGAGGEDQQGGRQANVGKGGTSGSASGGEGGREEPTGAGGTVIAGGMGGTGATGARCDFIEPCQAVPEPCTAMLGSDCDGCKIGTFTCGDVTGFYSDDGEAFPCLQGASGLDCADASAASGSHCAECFSAGDGGSSGTGGGGAGGSGGSGGAAPTVACIGTPCEMEGYVVAWCAVGGSNPPEGTCVGCPPGWLDCDGPAPEDTGAGPAGCEYYDSEGKFTCP